jgi:hypothetical protein
MLIKLGTNVDWTIAFVTECSILNSSLFEASKRGWGEKPSKYVFMRLKVKTVEFLVSGLVDGWHGNVDLLIMNNTDVELPVSFGQSSEDDVSVSESGDKVLDNEYSQMVAKTFVFSFLQHRQNPGKMQNNLIPSIGIKNEKLIVFMYDCDNDVLLGSHLLDLFDEGDIDVRIVIFLWFILNYKLFCTGLIDDYKFDNYQADFQTLLDKDCLQRYRNGVTMPCHSKTSHKRSFYPNKSDVPSVLEKRVKISNLPEILQWDIFDDRC